MPASSASCASRMLLSQELTQRSGIFVTDMPPEQFGEKKPNFNLLLFRIGDCFRPMKPRSALVAGFYEIDNLRIMPEKSDCSNIARSQGQGAAAPVGYVDGFLLALGFRGSVQGVYKCDELPALLFRQLRPDRHASADNSIREDPDK